MDEMKVLKKIDVVNGKEYGYIDLGKGVNANEVPEAENVIVVMAVSETREWKIPVSYHFVNTLTGQEKADMVKQTFIALHDTGVIATSLTFDGLQSNPTMCSL